MEQDFPIISKKVWSLIRVMFFMLKKGITKRKLVIDLNMMMKRGKIVSKTIFRRNNSHHLSFNTPPCGEYEFSCSNTPTYPLSLFSNHKKHQNKRQRNATFNPPLVVDDGDDVIISSAVFKALDMVIKADVSPMESPLPLTNSGGDYVDEAADKFIRRFYNGLRLEV